MVEYKGQPLVFRDEDNVFRQLGARTAKQQAFQSLGAIDAGEQAPVLCDCEGCMKLRKQYGLDRPRFKADVPATPTIGKFKRKRGETRGGGKGNGKGK